LLEKGAFAVEVGEVASQAIRDEIVAELKSRFPQLDTLAAEKQFKAEASILLSGVDEPSARRIVEELKKFKAPVRVMHQHRPRWWHWILNLGLVASAAAVLLAIVVGGWFGLLMILVAAAAPVVAELLWISQTRPLVVPIWPRASVAPWMRVASDYAQVIEHAEPEDREALASLAIEAFGLQSRLASGSTPSIAAGGQGGDLHKRLIDAIRTAVEIVQRLPDEPDDRKAESRKEVAGILELVKKTGQWFGALEDRPVKSPDQLSEDINQITERIDLLIQEVRTPASGSLSARDRTRS